MADRYWVGGTASWDGTAGTKWATTSGGTGGEPIPTTTDDVFFTNLSTGTVTIAAGNTGAKSINCTGFTGTITGTAAITVAGSITLSAGMTYTHTGTVTISDTGTITSAGKTFGNITVDGVGITVTLGDSVTSIGFVGLTNGTLNLNNLTLTADSFASSNSNVRTIAFGTGKIVITGTGGWSTLTSTNLTISGTPVVDVTNSGSVSVAVSPGNPTVANTVSFNFTAGTYALSISGNVRRLNFTGFSGTLSNGSRNVAGSIVFSSGMTVSAGASSTTFNATSGSNTITTNGKTLDFPVVFNGVGGAWQLQDALTLGSTRTMTLTNGSFDAATYSVTLGLFSSSNSNTRTISMGSGLWTLAGTGTVWTTATATNLTFNKGTADILLSSGSATARSFAGGGLSFNKITIGGATGSSTTNLQAINATELASTKPAAHTITITSATALSFDTWSVSGTAGNIVTLISSIAGTRRTFNLTNVTSGVDYLAVRDIECLQADRFYVGANSTDNGNNVNVIFTATPVVDVTVSVTGVEASGAAGSVVVEAGADVAVSGVEAPGAVGSVVVEAGAGVDVAVTGVAATGAVGTVVAVGDASTTVAGVAATGAVGTAAAAAGAVVSVSGVAATGAVGTAVAIGDAVTSITGVAATGAVGTAVAIGDAVTSITGVAASGAVGSATALVATDVSVLVDGVVATGEIGDADITGTAITTLTGSSGEGQVGSVTAIPSIEVPVSGVSAIGVVGSAATVISVLVFPIGVTATGQVGAAFFWDGIIPAPGTTWDPLNPAPPTSWDAVNPSPGSTWTDVDPGAINIWTSTEPEPPTVWAPVAA